MRRGTRILFPLVLGAALVACGSPDSPPDTDAGYIASPDGAPAPPLDGSADSAVADSATAGPDASHVVDSGAADSSALDAGEADSGERDSSVVDSGAIDSSVLDSGATDSGAPDATVDSGAPGDDSGSPDSGRIATEDSGPPDSGSPATDSGPADAGSDSSWPVDSGGPVADSAPPAEDAGDDSGMVVVIDSGAGDTGTGVTDAGPDANVAAVIHYVPGVTAATVAGSSVAGTQDGTGSAAQFSNPTGMAIDPNGDLLVTDYDSGRVRLVTRGGVVRTIGAATGFVYPFAAVVATDGAYYVATDADSAGAKGATSGTVWRVVPSADGGVSAPLVVATGFGRPRGLAAISGGDLFVSDRTEGLMQQLTTSTGAMAIVAGTAGVVGFLNATGPAAEFNLPIGSASLPDGTVIVADSGNNRIRRISLDGVVTTFAGTGTPSLVDAASCLDAGFNGPGDVAVDAAGNVYVSDIGNHVIRRIDTSCVVQTVAGTGVAGFHDGPGNEVQLYGEEGLDVTPDGKMLYVSDGDRGDGSAYHRIRSIAIP